MRNYATKLAAVARNTKYPHRIRKHIISNIQRFRGDITKSVLYWNNKIGITKLKKIEGRYFVKNILQFINIIRN